MTSISSFQKASCDVAQPVYKLCCCLRGFLYYHLKCMKCFIVCYENTVGEQVMFFSDGVYLVLAPNSLKRRVENPASFLGARCGLRPLFERDTLTSDSDKTRSVII